MNLTVKLTRDEAEKLIGEHVLRQFGLTAGYGADVTVRSYGEVEITLSPKDELVAFVPEAPPPSTEPEEIEFEEIEF